MYHQIDRFPVKRWLKVTFDGAMADVEESIDGLLRIRPSGAPLYWSSWHDPADLGPELNRIIFLRKPDWEKV